MIGSHEFLSSKSFPTLLVKLNVVSHFSQQFMIFFQIFVLVFLPKQKNRPSLYS